MLDEKNNNSGLVNIGLSAILFGRLISGVGGWWSAKEQSTYQEKLLASITGGDSSCYFGIFTGIPGWASFMLYHEGDTQHV